MTTFGTMKARIASDIERTLADTSHASRTWGDEIEDAIKDAIRLYKSKPYWFLQEPNATNGTITGSTTASDAYVADPTGLIALRSMRILVNGQREEMYEIGFDEMELRHDGTTNTGEPYEFNRYGDRIRLYPIPDDTYTLYFSGMFEEDALSDDADTNDWMTHGELLIRSCAKLLLYRDYIKSYDDVQAAQVAVAQAEQALDREHTKRTAKRRLKANC